MNILITKEWWMFKVIKLLLIAPIWSLYNVYCIKQIIESSSARFSWGRGHVSKTRVLLGPFHFPSQQMFRKVVPLQMWQMTLPLFVSLEVLLVKMMRLPLSFAAVSKRKQADFPSARKQQWEPNLQQHRWAAVTAWAETAGGGGWSSDTGEKQPEWRLTAWSPKTDACQHPHSQAWWWVRGPNVWELSIVTEVRSRDAPRLRKARELPQGSAGGPVWMWSPGA